MHISFTAVKYIVNIVSSKSTQNMETTFLKTSPGWNMEPQASTKFLYKPAVWFTCEGPTCVHLWKSRTICRINGKLSINIHFHTLLSSVTGAARQKHIYSIVFSVFILLCFEVLVHSDSTRHTNAVKHSLQSRRAWRPSDSCRRLRKYILWVNQSPQVCCITRPWLTFILLSCYTIM